MTRTSQATRATRRDPAPDWRRPRHPFFRPSLERLESRRLLSGAASPTLLNNCADAPMMFEANQGQTASQVRFLSHGNGYALFLTDTEAVLSLTSPSGASASGDNASAVLTMSLPGSNPAPRVTGLDEVAAKSNYLIGNDPSQWHTDVPNYGSVGYQGVYPGIDLTYYGSGQQLEYDFTVAPGADPAAIRLNFQGDIGMEIDAQGDLVLHTAVGDVVEHAPVLYQGDGADRQTVSGGYVLGADGSVGFTVGAYDPSRPLVIDPVLIYSTFLGNSYTTPGGEGGLLVGAAAANAVAADNAGDVYLTGTIDGVTGFPTSQGALQVPFNGYGDDAYVTKLNADGQIVFSTYLGGQGDESGVQTLPNGVQFNGQYVYNQGTGIAVHDDGKGNISVYVTGTTYWQMPGVLYNGTWIGLAPDQVVNAFQPNHPNTPEGTDAFVAELNPNGTGLVYSSYLGQTSDQASGIAVDAAGNAYVVGTTAGTGLFAARPYVARINANGSLAWDNPFAPPAAQTQGLAIAVSSQGSVYCTGLTNDPAFATQTTATTAAGGQWAFVARLNSDGVFLASKGLGGSVGLAGIPDNTSDTGSNGPTDGSSGGSQPANGLPYPRQFGDGIAVDPAGNVYITGTTFSLNFPTTTGAFQTSPPRLDAANGVAAAFVAKLTGDLSQVVYSTYLGGTHDVAAQFSDGSSLYLGVGDFGHAIAVDANGDAYVVGSTGSSDFPVVDGVQPLHAPEPVLGPNASVANVPGPSDAFVTELNPNGTSLVFSTYLGGSDNDVANGVAVDSSGDVFVVGTTSSGDSLLSMGGTTFPTLKAIQPSRVSPGLPVGVGPLGVNAGIDSSNFDTTSAFVARLAPPLRVVARPINALLGAPYVGVVATFTTPYPTDSFQATIDWGDGTTSPGSVVAPSSPGNPFQIIGSHTYNTLGSYPVGIRVVDTNNDHPAEATTATDVSREKGGQQETTNTVDPSNPNRLFAASNDQSFSANPNDPRSFFAAYSSDGGVTWARATDGQGQFLLADPSDPNTITGSFLFISDPRAIFDSFGNLFLVGLVGPTDRCAMKVTLVCQKARKMPGAAAA